LNGCMCCVLVGQMKNALLEIRDQYHPDRVIIETSGSAFPATLAFQIRDLEKETQGDFKLDAIVTVIDAENFIGYEDTSTTARMQAAYTDLILINKWENVSDRQLDIVLDHLHTLNDLTPKLKCRGRNGVPPNVVFGLDSKLFTENQALESQESHNDEVEVITVWRGQPPINIHSHAHAHHNGHEHLPGPAQGSLPLLTQALVESALESLPKESIYRVKGLLDFTGPDGDKEEHSYKILNWAFGRHEFTVLQEEQHPHSELQLTVMGEPGETKRLARKFAEQLGAYVSR